MEFKFTVQEYQTRAADAVARVFEGQPRSEGLQYVRDPGRTRSGEQMSTDSEFADGYRNAPLVLSGDDLLANVRKVQDANGVPRSAQLHHDLGAVELDVEMETGTGKTYVYTETIFELNRRYGWSKFIIVVPSVAIREGVGKSLEVTERHFMERYGKRIWWFVYNSGRLNELDSFASRSDISVMVINMQAFNAFDEARNKEGRGGDKTARIMFSERDNFSSRRPIDVLAATSPILILDEPQRMGKRGSATRRAMRQFRPLFSLNYSATHKERHNLVYALDALDAYNMRLVKRIEVKGFEVRGMRGTDGYLCLREVRVSRDRPPRAVIEFKRRLATGSVKMATRTFDEGDDVYVASGELQAYRGDFVVSEIVPDQGGISGHVAFRNGEVIRCGEVVNDSTGDDLRRVQIRETVKSHLEKEETLYARGIKCLSLFFIDEVSKYRVYDEDGQARLGEYGRVFEEEYQAAVEDRLRQPRMGDDEPGSYASYLRGLPADQVHGGYFSVDKGRAVNSHVRRGSDESDDETAYDLILRDKERLLSFDEPMRFIFSHSALREGWDNPNVFQICTLKESGSETGKRQEVGRGMRLCVDRHGDRQDVTALGEDMVQRVNLLTVIASESYSSFVSALQSDIQGALRERPREVTREYLEGFCWVTSGGVRMELDGDQARTVQNALVRLDYVRLDGTVSDKFRERGLMEEDIRTLPAGARELMEEKRELVEAALTSVYDPSALEGMIGNGLGSKVLSNPLNDNFNKREFQELWESINSKYVYTVHFDDEELRRKSIASIDASLSVSRVTYRVVSGEQGEHATEGQIRGGSHFSVKRTSTEELEAGAVHVRYDLVGEVAKRAAITRKSAAAILSGMSPVKFGLFRQNPEEFIARVGDIILDEKAAMVVEHISYDRTRDRYDAEVFTDAMPESMSQAYRARKNVQDYVFPDGLSERSVEQRFAEDLDAADEVVVYAKLPRAFQIPTPVGGYAPDWAIAFRRGSVKHVFFVAETKGSMRSMQLRGVERAKIECARRLFNEMSDADVRYDAVDSYESLLELVRG